MATLRRIVDEARRDGVARSRIAAVVHRIVERLLRKDPARRFASAKEVSELLEGCLAHVQQPASVPLPAEVLQAAVSRTRGFRCCRTTFQRSPCHNGRIRGRTVWELSLCPPPPDIAGQWSGDQWGHVVLKKTSDREYTGTYSDTVGQQPGEIQLKWSRIERRLTARGRRGRPLWPFRAAVGEGIRGAHTTDAKSKINPATPRLAGLAWTRAKQVQRQKAERNGLDVAAARQGTVGPVIEQADTVWSSLRAKHFEFRTGDVFEVGTATTLRTMPKSGARSKKAAAAMPMAVGGPQGVGLPARAASSRKALPTNGAPSLPMRCSKRCGVNRGSPASSKASPGPLRSRICSKPRGANTVCCRSTRWPRINAARTNWE